MRQSDMTSKTSPAKKIKFLLEVMWHDLKKHEMSYTVYQDITYNRTLKQRVVCNCGKEWVFDYDMDYFVRKHELNGVRYNLHNG